MKLKRSKRLQPAALYFYHCSRTVAQQHNFKASRFQGLEAQDEADPL